METTEICPYFDSKDLAEICGGQVSVKKPSQQAPAPDSGAPLAAISPTPLVEKVSSTIDEVLDDTAEFAANFFQALSKKPDWLLYSAVGLGLWYLLEE